MNTRKKFVSILLAFVLVISLMPTALAAESSYQDTDGHWAEAAIQRWSGYGVIQGNNGLFNPNGSLTRAHMAAVLSRLLKLPDAPNAGFSDVKEGDWHADYINRCAAAGIMLGSGGKANPNAPITRQQAIVMLGRALGIQPVENPDLSHFQDGAAISDYAKGYVAAMNEAGIVGGVTSDTLAGGSDITRAATVTILNRAIGTYANKAGATVKAASEGITLVVADDVTITGSAESVLVAQGALDGTVTLSSSSAGSVTVTAENATVYVTSESKADDVTLTETAVDSKVVVLKGAQVGTVTTAAPGSTVSVSGKVETVTTTETAEKASVEVAKNATVGEIAASGEKTEIAVSGKVENVTVADTATDTTVKANSGSTISKVDNAAEGTTVTGSGRVENVTTSGDNTTVSTPGTKVEASEGTSGTTAGGKDVAGGSSSTTGSSISGGSSHSHSWNAGVVTTGATCTTNGVKTFTCSCGATKTETIPATGHTYPAAWTYTKNGVTVTYSKTCTSGDSTITATATEIAAPITTVLVNDAESLYGAAATEAINNITLGANVTLTDPLDITKTLALDMNEKTITLGADVTDEAKDDQGIININNGGNLTIIGNGIFNYSMESGKYSLGYCTRVRGNGVLTIVDGTFHAALTCVQIGGAGTANIQGGTFLADYTYSERYWVLNKIDGSASTFSVTGGKFENYDPSNSETESPTDNFLADGYCVTQEDNYYVVSSLFSGGSGTEENPFLISSADQLKAFRDSVNAGTTYSGKYIQLTTDINLNNKEWLPIGEKAGDKFSGTFDGQNHKIEWLSITATPEIGNETTFNGYAGFFGAINGGTVKNLSVYGSVTGTNVAGVVARVDGNSSVINCHNYATVTSTSNAKAGGVICLTNAAAITVQNCTNSGAVSGGIGGTAGIVAFANPGVSISNCTNTGAIGDASSKYVGGIVGYATTDNSNAEISGCKNSGSICASVSAGGIVGIATQAWNIKNCTNSGAVSGAGSSGGIIGSVTNGTVSNCSNTATVHGDEFSGGVAGIIANAAHIVNCSGGTAAITSPSRTLTFNGNPQMNFTCVQNTCAGRLIGANQGAGQDVWAKMTIDDNNGDSYEGIGAIGICGNTTSWANIEIAGGTLHGTPAVGNTTYIKISENASWDDIEGRTPGTYTGTRIDGDTRPVWTLQTP